MSANSAKVRGIYNPANMEAYQCGKAANVAPAAVMSQTSLPSQTRPIEMSRTSRWDSLHAHTFIIIHTNTSTIHSTAMRINHSVGRNSMLFYLSDPVVARINMRRTTRRTMADHGRHHRVHQPKVQAYLRDDHPLYIALITQLRPLITGHI